MFRQKFAQVTDCSCRLIPANSKQYQIFKPQLTTLVPNHKEPKEKFSLKTQTTSSSKLQNKIPSAQKMHLKTFKPHEDQKISISANLDAKKQKLQKNLICSPENSNVRKLDQKTIFATNSNSTQSYFPKMPNLVKTAEANRKIDKKSLLNSHHQIPHPQNRLKDPQINNFLSQKGQPVSKHTFSRVVEAPKKSLNFDEYYRYVSNPYSVSEKNKENFHMGDNAQLSKYKIDLKLKKQMKKLKNQTMPLNDVENMPETQVFHESLEKYDNHNIKKSRGTHNGSILTQNSLNSQMDSMRTSKNHHIALMNSKLTNILDNPSLQFSKNVEQSRALRENQSLVSLAQKDPYTSTQRVSRMDFKNRLVPENQIQSENTISETHRPFSSIENSKVQNFGNTLENISVISLKPDGVQLFEGFNRKQPLNERIYIEKINTLNDIMNSSAQCESLLGQGETTSENEVSVVIMRYQDLVEETQNKEAEETQFWLQPEHLELNERSHQKPDTYMLDSTKVATNVKTYGKQYNSTGDSSISTNPHLKRTVKVSKQYVTENFDKFE